jgi:thiol-disulfide isomerase/thioredoxin
MPFKYLLHIIGCIAGGLPMMSSSESIISRQQSLSKDTTIIRYADKVDTYFDFSYVDETDDNIDINLIKSTKITDTLRKFNIDHPVLLIESSIRQMPFLVRPGEQLLVGRDVHKHSIFTSHDSIRNRELLFFKDTILGFNIYVNIRESARIYASKNAPPDFKALDSICEEKYKRRMHYLDTFSARHQLSKPFTEFCTKYFYYKYVDEYLQPFRITGRRYSNIPDFYLQKAVTLTMNMTDDTQLYIFPYREAQQSYLRFLTRDSDNPSAFSALYKIAQTRFSGLTREYLIFYLLKLFMDKNPPGFTDALQEFYTTAKNENYTSYLSTYQLSAIKNNTRSAISLLNDKGKTVAWKDIISSFRGNLIYVDVWASWCAPCREEMPFSKKLVALFRGKPITFLYVSKDENNVAWLKAATSEGLTTYSFLLLQPKTTFFNTLYKIETIPRYLLFDKQGKMIDRDAPRPSDPLVITLINKHLNKNP